MTKKKTTTKAPLYKYVGISSRGYVYASNCPVQVFLEYEYLIWPSMDPNGWTSDPDDAKTPVERIGEVQSERLTVMTYEEYLRRYPDGTKEKQLKFSM